MSTHRPGPGDGGVAFAPMGRSSFVERVVGDFEQTHGGVPVEIHRFILDEALVSDEEWEAGLREERIDEDAVREILLTSLEHSAQIAQAAGSTQLDVESASEGFHVVVESKGCAYPFLLC